MKKFILGALVMAASVVNAAEVVVLEANLPNNIGARTLVDTKFYMDTKTGEGFVKATVSEERYDYFPRTWCTYDPYYRCHTRTVPQPTQYTIFSDKVKVDNLVLMGDDAVYQGEEGNVVCGTMGKSRVFKVPTLYLSGNCKLSHSIRYENGNRKLTVTLKTK